MDGDGNYMFCVVGVNDLFIMNNEWREMDWVIYTVLTKLMHRQGFDSTIQHLEKTSLQGIRGSTV